jgi:DNA-binding beta-propeller fold protein YncE
VAGNPPPDDGTPPETDPPPEPPDLPPAAIYKRGSLSPLYELTPRNEYGRFQHEGVAMADADFAALGSAFTSSAQKMDEIAFTIAQESGLPGTQDLIANAADRQRAQQIPFRGNPSDVDFLTIDGTTKAFVPLGGDVMTAGNEVAIVTLGVNSVTRVRVGLRPQRVAVHESGLVFVCNQYSNYVSIIDARTNQLLRNSEGPIEIATDYYCGDLLLVERNPIAQNEDAVDLYIANPWRASVLKYGLEVVRDALNDRPIDVRVVEPLAPSPETQPAAEITGVGANPYRLSLSEAQDSIYVANSRGGELSRVSISQQAAVSRIALGGPTIDVVQVADSVFVPTTMRDRGLLARDEPVTPQQVVANPVVVPGLDGQSHQAHPGALFDGTRSYNFEDVRNGIFAVDFLLANDDAAYFTDDVSSEPNFAAQQKILAGALPQAVARTVAGDRIFIAMGGSDLVQELAVVAGAFKLQATGRTFATQERPFAIAVDDDNDQLMVVTWGGEVLEIFDLNNGQRLDTIDLGYAVPNYPATNMERGENLFVNAEWSNNGRKSCASCHLDELLADGIGFSNGATAPTAYHQVPANFNLMTTDSYFWNGSFANGTYTSLALAAQTRTNCELILFGMIEGPASDPNQRIGDPNNRVTDGQDAACRPDVAGAGQLPNNFDAIAAVIGNQKLVAAQLIEDETGLDREDAFRFVDFYSVAELRLPPNPLKHMHESGELDGNVSAKIEQGRALFESTGCANCHDPDNLRAPFTDGLDHGSGAEWAQEFVNVYFSDPRIVDEIGGIPQQMLEGITGSVNDSEINIHLAPVDYFSPFCFDATSCLVFEDPLVVRGLAAEDTRLDALVRINLADPDRGFVPGNVPGQPKVNTVSLRGLWWRTNFLHHGYANTVAEAILAPGHPALRDGELGFAINALGETDVHGQTSNLSPDQVEALILYVHSIE